MGRTKIPKDWVPSKETVLSISQDYPDITMEDIQYEHKQFRRWFLSSGKVYADWDSRFEFWCAENFEKRKRNDRKSTHVATTTKDVSDRQSRLIRVAKGGDKKQDGSVLRLPDKKRN